MTRTLNLDDLQPEDFVVKFRGCDYTFPGAMPAEMIADLVRIMSSVFRPSKPAENADAMVSFRNIIVAQIVERTPEDAPDPKWSLDDLVLVADQWITGGDDTPNPVESVVKELTGPEGDSLAESGTPLPPASSSRKRSSRSASHARGKQATGAR